MLKNWTSSPRVTWSLIVMIILLIWFSISVYSQQRWNMYYAVNDLYRATYNGYEDIKDMESNDFNRPYMLPYMLQKSFTKTIDLEHHFNFYEELGESDRTLYLNGNFFENGMTTLIFRKHQGLWNEVDKNYYEKLVQDMEQLTTFLEEEHSDFNRGSIFGIFDVQNYSSKIENINRLNYAYVSNHSVAIELIDKNRLIENISEQLGVGSDNVEIKEEPSSSGWISTYTFEVSGEDGFRGEISPFTGVITRISTMNLEQNGEPITKKEAQVKATRFLNKLFGGNYQYKFDYKGINFHHNFTGNDDMKIYSFLVTPLHGKYKYLQPFNNTISITVNKNTGEIYDYYLTSLGDKTNAFFSNKFFTKEFNEKVSVEEAKKILIETADKTMLFEEKIDPTKLHYSQTGIIYSAITGDFELVHEFQGKVNSAKIFINAEEGYIEKYYMNMD